MKKVVLYLIFVILFSCKQESKSDEIYLNAIHLSIEEYDKEYDINRAILDLKSSEQPRYYKETFEKLKSFEKSVNLFKNKNLSFKEKKNMAKELQTYLIHKLGLDNAHFLCLTISDEKLFNQILEFDLSRNSKNLSKHLIQIHRSAHGWVK